MTMIIVMVYHGDSIIVNGHHHPHLLLRVTHHRPPMTHACSFHADSKPFFALKMSTRWCLRFEVGGFSGRSSNGCLGNQLCVNLIGHRWVMIVMRRRSFPSRFQSKTHRLCETRRDWSGFHCHPQLQKAYMLQAMSVAVGTLCLLDSQKT